MTSQYRPEDSQQTDASSEISLDGAIDLIFTGHGVGASLFANAAIENSGAEIFWIASSQAVAKVGSLEYMIDGPVLNESSVGAAIITNKGVTKSLLQRADVRTPRGFTVNTADEAVARAKDFSRSFVLKPLGGSKGLGVTVDVKGENELRRAFDYAQIVDNRPVLLEEYIDIENEYRCLATADECVAVIERTLPYVTGDGKSTIKELIVSKNESRRNNPGLRYLPIPIDEIVDIVLSRQGLELSSVPSKGTTILVRNVGGLSGGGEPHEVSDKVDEEIKALAQRTVATIPGLGWGAVDIVTERHSGKPFVIEINCRAHYAGATFPVTGKPRDIASGQWDVRVKRNAPDTPDPQTNLSHVPATPLTEDTTPGSRAPKIRLSDLFLSWAESEGFQVNKDHRTIITISRQGVDQWFTGQLLSTSDLLSSTSIFRRHSFVRDLLTEKGMFRTRGGLFHTWQEAHRIAKSDEQKLIAVKSNNSWRAASSTVTKRTGLKELFDRHPKWYVQNYPPGRRLSVIASRSESFAAIARERSDNHTVESLRQASNLAVRGVRAIPELRWAAVDLVFVGKPNQGHWRIEGLAFNPTFSHNHKLIAGDMRSFYAFLLNT